MGSIEPSEFSMPGKRLKTIDWGCNGTMMSFDQFGTVRLPSEKYQGKSNAFQFLQLGVYHPKHGVVLLAPFKQFDGCRFYDPAYVRSYRTKLLDYVDGRKPGFGVQIQGVSAEVTVISRHPHKMCLRYHTVDGIQVQRTVSMEADGSVKQTTVLSTLNFSTVCIPVQLDLGMSLNRASYGQLTEGGPLPLPESLNVFRVAKDGSSFTLHNPNLGAKVEGVFSSDSADFDGMSFHNDWQTLHDEPVQCKAATRVKVVPGVPVTLTLLLRLQSQPPLPGHHFCENDLQNTTWSLHDPVALNIILGNLQYVLGNCTLPVSESSTCVITDHVALPLGWNRDN
jgi:uncharacterized protein